MNETVNETVTLVMKELREIRKRIEELERKLDDLLDSELTEEELREVREIIEACKTGKMKTYTLEELKKELEIDV